MEVCLIEPIKYIGQFKISQMVLTLYELGKKYKHYYEDIAMSYD